MVCLQLANRVSSLQETQRQGESITLQCLEVRLILN